MMSSIRTSTGVEGKFTGRAEVGRELSRVFELGEELRVKLDRNVVTALCLSAMSGLNDLVVNVLQGAASRNEDSQAKALGIIDSLWFQTESLLLFAWVLLPESKLDPGEPPPIRFHITYGVKPEEESAALAFTIKNGRMNEDKDLIVPGWFRLPGLSGILVTVGENTRGTAWEQRVAEWISARKLIGDTFRVNELLKRGQSMWKDEEGLHHPTAMEPETEESIRAFQHIAYAGLGAQRAYKWATDLEKVASRTVAMAGIGRGALNRSLLRREREAIRSGFLSLPKFAETFREEMGFSFDEFWKVTWAIEMLGYPRASCVYLGTPDDVLRRVAKKSELPKGRVSQILAEFDLRARDMLARPVLPLSKHLRISSYDWAASFRLFMLDRVFFDAYDFDLRGKVFEARCRKAFAGFDFRVVPERVKLEFPKGLVEAHLERFHFEKTRTDFDLVAHYAGVLVLGECKELKSSLESLRKREMDFLELRRQELGLIAEWMAADRRNLASCLSREVLAGIGLAPEKVRFILPAFITNQYLEFSQSGPAVVRVDQFRKLKRRVIWYARGVEAESGRTDAAMPDRDWPVLAFALK